MMEMSVDFLKNTGAGIVAAFRTAGVPLTDGIVKVAGENQLNPEQTARLVETVNQLAYLSGPHASHEKTAEFPLADYEEVITKLITPIEKSAAYRPSPLSLLVEPLEKTAGYEEISPDATMLRREFFAGRDNLKRMDIEETNIVEGLLKSAAVVSKDPEALSKIAALTGGDSKAYGELCTLVFGHVKEASAGPSHPQESLLSVKSLIEQLGFAKQASEERKSLEDRLVKIAEEICPPGMDKEAFIGSVIRAAGAVFRGAKPGLAGAGKGLKLGGTVAMAGPEVAQISRSSAPKNDVWSSLHN